MKKLVMLVLAALAQTGFAGSPQAKAVTVCTVNLPDIGFHAQSMADKMFATAGIEIDWRSMRSCPADAIRVRFVDSTLPSEFPGAYAYALPYEESSIVVFYDRLRQCSACTHAAGRSAVLAHVLVHEITHVLQGVCRHSTEGVMKPTFTLADMSGMAFAPLPFTSTDLYLLRQGIAKREAHQLAAR